jgi:subtilisin family serine protease
MRTRIILSTLAMLFAVFAIHVISQSTKVSAKNEKFRRSERPIPNRYIVVLNDTDEYGQETKAAERAAEHARGFSMRVNKVYDSSIKGYAAEMSDTEAVRLSEDSRIRYIEQDSIVEETDSQSNVGWGLDRIDQRTVTYDNTFSYSTTGAGVNIYILDSGVMQTHIDLQGRVVDAFDAVNDNTPISQCNGHGTGVAGVAGGSTYGVAKNALLHSVRVLPCTGYGSLSDTLAGVDWVTRHAVKPAVANMSLGTSSSATLNSAVAASIASGVVYVVAAGNESDDACRYSPSGATDAITVGGTKANDERIAYSNFGRCVDIFAPGEGVRTIWNTTDSTFTYASGTSFASPYAAGVAALFLERNPTATPQQVRDAMTANATADVVTLPGANSPNLLLFSGFVGAAEPPPPTNPDPNACLGVGYSGNLDSGGASNYQSSANGFNGGTGSYSGRLRVPAGMTFVLSLEQKKGRSWTAVANSPGSSETEIVSFKGKSGTYRWRVRSVYGSGDYNLCSLTP